MKKSIRARAFAPALSVLSLAVAASVQAQTSELNSVVVTATRFESSPQSSPIATQIITADEITDSSAITVSEVLSKLGGVHIRNSFTGIPDAAIDLRGFGATGDQNTLVLINGQRLSENEGVSARLSSIPINSIDRIEILRGAGAVLFGSGATGGTINIITKTPTEDGVSGSLSTLVGTHSLNDSRANMQAKSGDLALSLTGQKYKTDNYRHGNQAEAEAINTEIRYGGKDEFIALTLGSDDQNSRLPGVRRVDIATGLNQLVNDPRGVTTPKDYLNSETNFVSLRGERAFQNLKLAVDVAQRKKTRRSVGSFESDGAFYPAGTQTQISLTDTDQTSVSPRVLWASYLSGMKNLLTVGTDWSEWGYANNTSADGPFGPSTVIERGAQSNRAVYFRDEFFITSKTRLSFGGRSETVKQDSKISGISVDPFFGVSSYSPLRSVENNLSAHEVAIQHAFDNGYTVYGRLSRSFRVANIDENRCFSATCNPLLRPQTSNDREIGAEWRGEGASFRAGLFDMDVRDEIHYNPFKGFGENMNLSPTERQGFELEGKLRATKTVDVGVRYTYTQARFKEGVFLGQNLAGKDVPLVPKDRLSVNLGWKFLDKTRMTLHVNYISRQRYDNDQPNNFYMMPSYTTADVKVVHEIGCWTFAVGVNNLLNEAYYSYGVTNASAAPSRYNVYPEDRRNGYLSAQYRF